MVQLPVGKGLKLNSNHRTDELYFLNPVFDENGKLTLKEPEVLDVELPFPNVSLRTHARRPIIKASSHYFVVAGHDHSVFTVIQRGSLDAPLRFSPGDASSLYEKFLNLRNCKKRVICIPSACSYSDILIRGEQIFFRTSLRTFIYTPYSTSIIEVSSHDFCSDYYLYFLDKRKITIYGNKVIREIPLSHECKEIRVVDGIVFLSRRNDIYRVAEDGSVTKFRTRSRVLKIEVGDYLERHPIDPGQNTSSLPHYDCRRKIYALLQAKRLLILDIWTLKEEYVSLNGRFKVLHITPSYIVAHDRANGYRWFDRKDPSKFRNFIIDPIVAGIAFRGNELCFHTDDRIITQSSGAPWVEGLLYDPPDVFQKLLKYSSAKNNMSLEEVEQAIIDGRAADALGSRADMSKFCEVVGEYTVFPDEEEDSSESSAYFFKNDSDQEKDDDGGDDDEVERDFREIESALDSLYTTSDSKGRKERKVTRVRERKRIRLEATVETDKQPKRPKDMSEEEELGKGSQGAVISAVDEASEELLNEEKYKEEMKEVLNNTGIDNPLVNPLFIKHKKTSPTTSVLHYRKSLWNYRKTRFFLKNYTSWLEKNYDDRQEDRVELEYPTFEYISSLVLKSVPKADKPPRYTQKPVTRPRRGGGGF